MVENLKKLNSGRKSQWEIKCDFLPQKTCVVNNFIEIFIDL